MLSLDGLRHETGNSASILSLGILEFIVTDLRLRADLTLLLVATFGGSAFVAQRFAGQMGSVYLFNGARYLVAAVVVFPVALRNSRTSVPAHIISPHQYRLMFLAGFVLFLGSALQQLGVVYTTAGNAGFITSLYVVLAPIVLFVVWREKERWFFLPERLTGIQIFGCMLIFVAVLLSQFKEWNLRGKIDRTHLVEGR